MSVDASADAVALLLVAALALAAVAASSDIWDFATRLPLPGVRTPARVQVVVARYAEDVSWLRLLPFRDVVVYDKNDRGDRTGGNPPAWARVLPLPNVGRCDHSYLHHIVHNWDRLADVTLFLPGSCSNSQRKWNKLAWVTARVCKMGDSAFPLDMQTKGALNVELGNFALRSYQATGVVNAGVNPESRLKPCAHRPFGKFYRHAFPDQPQVRGVVYQGVFAVSRAHIRQHPRQRYERLLRLLDDHSNPEAGHYVERAWLAAFHPVPRRCTRLSEWDDSRVKGWTAYLGCVTLATLLAWSRCLGR